MWQQPTRVDLSLRQERSLHFRTPQQKIEDGTIDSQAEDNGHIRDSTLEDMQIFVVDLSFSIGWVSGNSPGEEVNGTTQVIVLHSLRCLLFQICIIAARIGVKNEPPVTDANTFFLEILKFERQLRVQSNLLLCQTCGSSILQGSIHGRSGSSPHAPQG